jgi:hypothetical protein
MPQNNDAAIQVRINGTLFDQLENWRRSQKKIPPRSEALRLLVKTGLDVVARPSGREQQQTTKVKAG